MKPKNPQTKAEWFDHFVTRYRKMTEGEVIAARSGWKAGSPGFEAAEKVLAEFRAPDPIPWHEKVFWRVALAALASLIAMLVGTYILRRMGWL
jgi:anti-sigma-K factor RskA